MQQVFKPHPWIPFLNILDGMLTEHIILHIIELFSKNKCFTFVFQFLQNLFCLLIFILSHLNTLNGENLYVYPGIQRSIADINSSYIHTYDHQTT